MGVPFAKHWHPGEEIIYVLEGSLQYQIEDKPPVTLKAGDVSSSAAFRASEGGVSNFAGSVTVHFGGRRG